MRRKGSRYENTRAFSDAKGFSGLTQRELTSPPGIVEHTVLHSDRLDQLAHSYYQADRRWWRLMDANAEFLYGFELLDKEMQGDVLAIPASREAVK
ncbi:MAG: hypothetical protein HOM14_09780 [Gammaproteobacteria bacterium]|jgi:hypothetical protein|nr:hypothetical protein [Gammaproteobacteria bacterium]MBT3723277.1 hypothetical protein [Gammaproteobacteria bacterium]MBT4194865.1 hypothetical protein [Gammaproteobacteria bacterium]MBT4448473.1 hypothetical protein [Gammaproteobacteria bacterium]MBT4860302.1 hypothetical protein [Gammaproteobacteria bacterium]